jgi:hypothetical protein
VAELRLLYAAEVLGPGSFMTAPRASLRMLQTYCPTPCRIWNVRLTMQRSSTEGRHRRAVPILAAEDGGDRILDASSAFADYPGVAKGLPGSDHGLASQVNIYVRTTPNC